MIEKIYLRVKGKFYVIKLKKKFRRNMREKKKNFNKFILLYLLNICCVYFCLWILN